MTGLQGRTAIVTGGAGGIGRALVAALAQAGARVAVFDRAAAPEDAVLGISVDVSAAAEVDEAVRAVADALGPPTLLVCAAGVVSESEVVRLDPGEWRRVVDASLTGTFLVARAALPYLAGDGRIVAFSSGWATKGYPRGAHYAAAKAGVEALVKSLALETARDGVRVNAVAPGPVLTPMLDSLTDADAMDAWRRAREARIPMGRMAEPADLVGPVMFLLGDGSRYMTGQILHVNGGMLLP